MARAMGSLSSFGHRIEQCGTQQQSNLLPVAFLGGEGGRERGGSLGYPYAKGSSFVFLVPISASNRRFRLHLSTLSTIRRLPGKRWGRRKGGRARGQLYEAGP